VDWEGRLGVLVKSLRVMRVAYSATVSLNYGAGSHGPLLLLRYNWKTRDMLMI